MEISQKYTIRESFKDLDWDYLVIIQLKSIFQNLIFLNVYQLDIKIYVLRVIGCAGFNIFLFMMV